MVPGSRRVTRLKPIMSRRFSYCSCRTALWMRTSMHQSPAVLLWPCVDARAGHATLMCVRIAMRDSLPV
jgi:hypothetical protein